MSEYGNDKDNFKQDLIYQLEGIREELSKIADINLARLLQAQGNDIEFPKQTDDNDLFLDAYRSFDDLAKRDEFDMPIAKRPRDDE